MDSKEMLKKTLLMGIGATVLTAGKLKEALQETVDEWVDKGHVKPQEAKAIIGDTLKRLEKEKSAFEAQLQKTVQTQVQKAIHALGLVSRDELDAALGKTRKKSVARKAGPKAVKPTVKAARPKAAAARTTKTAKAKPARKPVAKKPAGRSKK